MTRYAISPRTERARAKILAAIAETHMSAQNLADLVFLSRDGVNRHLKKMREEKLIYIAAYGVNRAGGQPAPRYMAGDNPDSQYVFTRAPTKHLVVSERMAAIEHALRYKKTSSEMAEMFGLSNMRIRFYISEIRKIRAVHICGWKTLPAGIAPIYALGKKPDAPKPPKSRSDYYARLMERRKTDPDLNDKLERKRLARNLKDKAAATKRKPQNIFSALGL